MAAKMFCGELNGDLVTGHLDHCAWVVRRHIAYMFEPGAPDKVGWEKAKREGWRVVPVKVEKIKA
jgi:hypothetical protein